jgi:hypothetical protein
MQSWTITIQATAATPVDTPTATALRDALAGDGLAFAPTAQLDPGSNTLSSTFLVQADTIAAAANIGVRAYERAARATRLPETINRLEITHSPSPHLTP